MKSFYFICGLVLIYSVAESYALELPDHLKNHAIKLHRRCQQQIGIDEEILKQASTQGTFPSDRKFQCYVHCLFDIIGLIDEKNIVHLENILEVLPEETHAVIKGLIEACGTQHGADGCETVYQTVKCYNDLNPSIFHRQFEFVFA